MILGFCIIRMEIKRSILTAHRSIFIGGIPAVVAAVALVRKGDAEIIVALELRLRTVSPSGVFRYAANFVAHVLAISSTVAVQRKRNAVAARALVRVVLNGIQITLNLGKSVIEKPNLTFRHFRLSLLLFFAFVSVSKLKSTSKGSCNCYRKPNLTFRRYCLLRMSILLFLPIQKVSFRKKAELLFET